MYIFIYISLPIYTAERYILTNVSRERWRISSWHYTLVFTHFWQDTAAAEPYSLYLRLIDSTLPPEGIVLIHIFKTQ